MQAKFYAKSEEEKAKFKENHSYRFNNPNGNSEIVTLNGHLKVTGSKSSELRELLLTNSVDYMIQNGILEKISQKIQEEDKVEVHLYR